MNTADVSSYVLVIGSGSIDFDPDLPLALWSIGALDHTKIDFSNRSKVNFDWGFDLE